MEAMLKLKIPASTANLGVGFDSIGMALNKYLHMNIKACLLYTSPSPRD